MDRKTRKERLQIPTGKLRLVIDTDAKNEVDDQFAIAWALKSPERFEVEAVYAAPFSHDCFASLDMPGEVVEKAHALIGSSESPADGMKQSYDEILRVYRLLHLNPAGKVFYGSEDYIGEDGAPVASDAADDLIRRARESEEILYVAALGAITNIASAILMAPEIVDKIVIVWLAGQPLEFGHGIEFNLMQDVKASQIILNSGVPLVLIPCMHVASLLTVTEEELRYYLEKKNEISEYLYSIVKSEFGNLEAEISMIHMNRKAYLRGQEDQDDSYLNQFTTKHISWTRIVWDIAVIAFLKNPSWVTSTLITSPILNDDLTWSREKNRHEIRIANYCHRSFIYGDMFYELTRDQSTKV